MPGPVSDSYDVEWGTRARAQNICRALGYMHARVGSILRTPPQDIRDLVDAAYEHAETEDIVRQNPIVAELSEWEWRILRFACERAAGSV